MYLHRTIEPKLLNLSDGFPVILLTGSRQVGKTTLLEKIGGKERGYVSLDDPIVRELATSEPQLFLQRFAPPITIDEIQYAPTLLPYIKLEVDRSRRNGSYWLTGSQQFPLMKGVTESLAGRVAIVTLAGLSLRERLRRHGSAEPFLPSLDSYQKAWKHESRGEEIFALIHRGAYPRLTADKDLDWSFFHGSYLQTYLQRDVRDFTRVGDLAAFTRFVKACAARTGQLLNVAELARDVGIDQKTAKAWLSVLEAGNLVLLLPPYHSNRTTRIIKTPKLYFLDTGLCAYLTGWNTWSALRDGAMAGAFFETFVVAEIYKSYLGSTSALPLFFYRDKDGCEIDVLIEHDGMLYPVEIKKSANPSRDWIRHFSRLDSLGLHRGHGAAICLIDTALPIDNKATALPVWNL
jgi:predicted AAA+ superfamily ATPase